MADNKDLRDGRDRSRVAGEEPYEVQYMADRYGVSPEEIRRLIEEVGNNRQEIEEALQKRSSGR